jgi:hypothetical protein
VLLRRVLLQLLQLLRVRALRRVRVLRLLPSLQVMVLGQVQVLGQLRHALLERPPRLAGGSGMVIAPSPRRTGRPGSTDLSLRSR